MAGDWSGEQNGAIVADYFAMLGADIAGRPYSKAAHNRLLQAVIDRPRGSIEYKHQNISAVLKGLGEDWIPGYKPAFTCNCQSQPKRKGAYVGLRSKAAPALCTRSYAGALTTEVKSGQ